jgi:hypothetical protein
MIVEHAKQAKTIYREDARNAKGTASDLLAF